MYNVCMCSCIQIGGGDQWGNITAGCEFVRKAEHSEVHGEGSGYNAVHHGWTFIQYMVDGRSSSTWWTDVHPVHGGRTFIQYMVDGCSSSTW